MIAPTAGSITNKLLKRISSKKANLILLIVLVVVVVVVVVVIVVVVQVRKEEWAHMCVTIWSTRKSCLNRDRRTHILFFLFVTQPVAPVAQR